MVASGVGSILLSDPIHWSKVTDAFGELVELSPEERAERLAGFAIRDPTVHAELLTLLASHEALGDQFSGAAAWRDRPSTMLGRRFHAFRVTRLVAEGGMGAVYEAERVEGGFDQRVAIKVLLAGLETPVARARFAHERRLLASLSHRNIATLIDGGVDPDGVSWIAMEYVDGVPITTWCHDRKLGVRDRLALFRQVTAAVQHAHSHLVVHRDLKPSNILVASDGTVKLLDFGVAKLLEPVTADQTAQPRTGLTPFTAAYGSPEQHRGDAANTASDIYSLGVVLYEIIAERRPFEKASDRSFPPSPPSRVPGAQHFGVPPRDLDAVVLTALREEPDRRYSTAQQMGDDIQQLLAGGQVRARPDTVGYRLRTTIRRNRAASWALGLALIALILGAGMAWRQAVIATAARDRAEQEAARTRRVTEFLRTVLNQASPQLMGRNATVLGAIDAALGSLDSAFAGESDLRAAVQNTLGATFTDLQLAQRAQPLVQDAVDTLRHLAAGRDQRELADAIYNLAGVEAALEEPVKAESLYHESFAMYLRLTPGDSSAYLGGLNNLALSIHAQGRVAEAIPLYLKSARWHQAVEGKLSREAIPSLINAATGLTELGQYDSAGVVFNEAIHLIEVGGDTTSSRLAALLQARAGALMFQSRFTEAESEARRAWAIWRIALGSDNPTTLTAVRILVNILAEANRCRDAVALSDTILARRHTTLTDTDPTVGTALLFAGWCRVRLGESKEGVADVREGLALRRAGFPATHWAVAHAEAIAGKTLIDAGRANRQEGLALLRLGYAGMARELRPENVRLREAKRWLVEAERIDR